VTNTAADIASVAYIDRPPGLKYGRIGRGHSVESAIVPIWKGQLFRWGLHTDVDVRSRLGKRPVTGGWHLFQSAPHLFRPDQKFWVAGTGSQLAWNVCSQARPLYRMGGLYVKAATTVRFYLPMPADGERKLHILRRRKSLAG
jgi:hypothetical protein